MALSQEKFDSLFGPVETDPESTTPEVQPIGAEAQPVVAEEQPLTPEVETKPRRMGQEKFDSLFGAAPERAPPSVPEKEEEGFFGNIANQIKGGFYDLMSRESTKSALDTGAEIAAREEGTFLKGPGKGRRRRAEKQRLESEPDYKEKRIESLKSDMREKIKDAIEYRNKGEAIPMSQATQDFLDENSGKTIWEAFSDAPATIIIELGSRSAVNMLPGLAGGVALGVAGTVSPIPGAGPAGFAAGMGAGSARIEYAASIVDGLRKAKVNIDDADSLMKALQNKPLMEQLNEYAMRRAAIIGGLDALAGLIGAKQLAPGISNALMREFANVAIQAPTQAVLGGGGEALAELATGEELQPRQIAAEAAGELVTAPIEVTAAGVTGIREQAKTKAENLATEDADRLSREMDEVEKAHADGVEEAAAAGGDELDQALAGAQGAAEVAARQGDEVAATEEASVLQEALDEDLKQRQEVQTQREAETAKEVEKQQAAKTEKVEKQAAVAKAESQFEQLRKRRVELGLEKPSEPAAKPEVTPVEEPVAPVTEAPASTAMREALQQAEIERANKKKGGETGVVPTTEIAQEPVTPRRAEAREGKERRKDNAERRRINDMSLEEAQHALSFDEMTGLRTRRAYEDSDKMPWQGEVDADSLAWINDNMSEESGDILLKEIASEILKETDQAYRMGGDEYIIQANSKEEIDAIMERVSARLAEAEVTVERPDGEIITKSGIEVTHGTGQTKDEAGFDLKKNKVTKQKAGLRAERKTQPAGVVRIPAEGKQGGAGGVSEVTEQPSAEQIAAAASEAATSPTNNLPLPTEAQKEAGNYKKGHVKVQGIDVTVENPKGSVRTGVDESGRKWSQKLKDIYGYIKRTNGADGDQVDAFIGTNPESETVFVIDQVNQQTGEFDEHKVMVGYNNQLDALRGYKRNFENGWQVGPMTEMTAEQFKVWLREGDTTTAIREAKIAEDIENTQRVASETEIEEMVAAQSRRGRKTKVVYRAGEEPKESSRLKSAKSRIPAATEEDVTEILGEPGKRTPKKPAKPAPKVSTGEVEKIAASVRAKMPGVKITVVGNVNDLPADLSQQVKDDYANGSKGLYIPDTDQIYILSDNATSIEDAESTIAHEVVGHKGLQGLLGEDFDSIMDELYNSITDKKALDAMVNKFNMDDTTSRSKRIVAEEYAARIAEKGIDAPILQRLITKIRAVLRKMGMVGEWSNEDIKGLLRAARRRLQSKPLNEITLTTQVEVEETGDIVNIDEQADIAMRQLDKRRGMVEQLRGCLG